MEGRNKGETIDIKRVNGVWWQKYKYYQSRFSRISKNKAIGVIRNAFEQNKPYLASKTFELELIEINKNERYYWFEYFDDLP